MSLVDEMSPYTARTLSGNVEPYEQHPLQPKTPGWLDYRTYTTFEIKGEYVLYDVNTGSVLLLNRFAFDILASAKHQTRTEIIERYGSQEHLQALEEINVLRKCGFFQYEGHPSNVEAEAYFEDLFNHAPRRIQLFVAQACNLACKYCYAEEQGSNAKNRLMTFEIAKQAVDYLVSKSRRRRGLSVQFFGGEALLNFKLIKEVVDYCKSLENTTKKKFSFQISTNGVLLTEEVSAFLVKHKFASLVSVDGDREQHDSARKMRSGGGSYDRVVGNALRLQDEYVASGQAVEQLKIRATLNASNPSSISVADALEAAGFKYIGVGSMNPRPFETGSSTYQLSEDQERRLEQENWIFLDRFVAAMETNDKLTYSPFRGRLSDLKNRSRYYYGIMCGVGRNTNAVDTDGKMYPCHRYVGMEKYVIGDIWHGLDKAAIINYYRQVHYTAKPKCSGCWTRRLCGGLCTWMLSSDDGAIWRATERMCESIRRGMEKSLYLRAIVGRYPDSSLMKELEGETLPGKA